MIQQWLKIFMLANHHNFELRASKYLAPKVLIFINWMDSVSEGREGDILALYGLCMLFEKHAVVHLHNGVIWSTLAELSAEHTKDIEKCDVHLCYLGRGLFVELVKRDVPLQILDDAKDHVKSLVVCELTIKEATTVDMIIHTGLGVALDSNVADHCQPTVKELVQVLGVRMTPPV